MEMPKKKVKNFLCPGDIQILLNKLKKAMGQESEASVIKLAIIEAAEKRGIR